jgi:hypothetical protein
MFYRSHVIVLMVAACLGGCGGYAGYVGFDQDDSSALPPTSVPAGGQGGDRSLPGQIKAM